MQYLLKDKSLLSSENIPFFIQESGWYLFSVIAMVKSEKQRGENETDDEDLTLRLDEQVFPSLTNSGRLMDSPAAFSGGRQHNADKTLYIFIQFSKGNHELVLVPQHGAYIQEVGFEKIEIIDDKVSIELNLQAVDRDRKPWITFVTVGASLNKVYIEAITKWRFLDGDDIQIRINDLILKNTTSVFHKDWILSAMPIIDFFKGKKETTILMDSEKKLNYIELFADRTPTINKIVFSLEDTLTRPLIQKYTDYVYHTRDYNRYDEVIIKAVDYWNNFFSQQEYPPDELLDPSLVKAMLYRESTIGYNPDNNGEVDIMQVWDERNPVRNAILSGIANEFINTNEAGHISYSFPKDRVPPNVATPEESIFWGVRWLYSKAQRYSGGGEDGSLPPYFRNWLTWKKAVYLYNNGPLVEAYIKEVFSIYSEGVDEDKNILWKK